MSVSLVRDPALPEGGFILRLLYQGTSMSGCPKLNNPAFETEYIGPFVNITVEDVTIDENASYRDCNAVAQSPKADVIMNRQELADKGVEKVQINNGDFKETFKVILTDHSIALEQDCSLGCGLVARPQKIYGSKDSLRLWFYPAGTVVLYVSSTGDVPDAARKVRNMAAQRGLTPLTDIISDFSSPLVRAGMFYYVDDKGLYLREGEAGPVPVGAVQLDKTIYGLHGDEMIPQDAVVFARRPGPNE
ncbi:MAG: hypothetical protein HY370_00215 [Proteobacteria bacterium]|nr:hypothetical protein [Pseudomonadota bacterium]